MSFVTRVTKLQQVMSSNALTSFAADEKLKGSSNFYDWFTLISVKMKMKGLGLYAYLINGETGTDGLEDSNEVAQLVATMDEIISTVVFNSITGAALTKASEFDGTGRNLFMFLKEAYGTLTVTNAVGIICDLMDNKWLKTKEGKVEHFIDAFNHFKNTVGKLDGSTVLCALFLGLGQKAGFGNSLSREVMTAYESRNGRTIGNVDLGLVQDLTREIIGDKSIASTSIESPEPVFATKKQYKCFNCGKPGHFRRDCKAPKREKLIGDGRNPSPSWYAFMGMHGNNSRVYFDSGASQHILNNKSLFKTIRPFGGEISGIDGGGVAVAGIGSAEFKLRDNTNIEIKDAYYVPDSKANLISVSKATLNGAKLLFEGNKVKMYPEMKVIGTKDPLMNGLYRLSTDANGVAFNSIDKGGLWHQRLGHPSANILQKANKMFKLVKGKILGDNAVIRCDCCLAAKGTVQKPKLGHGSKPKRPLELLHMDVCGPFSYGSIDSSAYFLTIVDGYAKYVETRCLTQKSECTAQIIDFINYSETMFKSQGKDFRVGTIRTDNGGEFITGQLHAFLRRKGIAHELTVPHHSYQNGVAERMNRTIQDKTRSLMIGASMPAQFWPEAVRTAAYLTNRTPSRVIGFQTPYRRWFGYNPGLDHLRCFGCIGYVVVPHKLRYGKLGATSKMCVMLGYDRNRCAYRMFDPEANRVVTAAQVNFDESRYYFQDGKKSSTVAPEERIGISGGGGGGIIGGISAAPIIMNDDLVDVDVGSRNGSAYHDDETTSQISVDDASMVSESDAPDKDIEMSIVETKEYGDGELIPSKVYDDAFQLVTATKRKRSSGSRVKESRGIIKRNPFGILAEIEEQPDTFSSDSERESVTEKPQRKKFRNTRNSEELTSFVPNGSSNDDLVVSKIEPHIEEPSDCDEESELNDDTKSKLLEYKPVNYVATCFMAGEADAISGGTDVPGNYKEAMKSDERVEWKRACDEEIAAHKENSTYELVELPKGRKPITCRWVFAKKDNGVFKGRLVARGFTQVKGIDYNETFSPVVRYESIRLMLSIAAKNGMAVHQMDVKTAFLNGFLQEELYMTQPEGYVVKGRETSVLRLKKSLYGLKQAPLVWNERIHSVLSSLGFVRNGAEYCLYSRKSEKSFVMVALYVDDLLIAGTSDFAIGKVKSELMNVFKMKDLGVVKKFLGMNISQDDGGINMSLKDYIGSMLKEFGMENCNHDKTPTISGQELTLVDANAETCDATAYRSLVGKLLFAANTVRSDISYIVGVLSRYLKEPKEVHYKAAKRVLRYLKGTKELGIRYEAGDKGDGELVGYCDADWAGDKSDRKSTTGFVFKYANGAITWRSKKQATVALSTAEAEYMSLSEGVKEALWLKQVFEQFGLNTGAVKIYDDNQGCIEMAKHPAFHHRTKHIDIRTHFIRDHIGSGTIDLQYLNTGIMVADMFTKGLAAPQFIELRKLCGMVTLN